MAQERPQHRDPHCRRCGKRYSRAGRNGGLRGHLPRLQLRQDGVNDLLLFGQRWWSARGHDSDAEVVVALEDAQRGEAVVICLVAVAVYGLSSDLGRGFVIVAPVTGARAIATATPSAQPRRAIWFVLISATSGLLAPWNWSEPSSPPNFGTAQLAGRPLTQSLLRIRLSAPRPPVGPVVESPQSLMRASQSIDQDGGLHEP